VQRGQRRAVQPDVVSACSKVRVGGPEAPENVDTDGHKLLAGQQWPPQKHLHKAMPEEGLEPPTRGL
jgi:hypothetical protein